MKEIRGETRQVYLENDMVQRAQRPRKAWGSPHVITLFGTFALDQTQSLKIDPLSCSLKFL